MALILPKSEEFVFTFLGAMHGGFVPVPVAPPMSIARLGPYLEHMKNIIEASEASFLITSPQIKRLMGSLLGGTLRAIRTVEEIQVSNEEMPLASLKEDDLAFIQFTSGSTTNPRGVSLTHKNLMANAHCIMNLGLQVTAQDVGGREEGVVVCAETKEDRRRYPELEKAIRARVIKDLGIKIGDVVMLKPGSLLKTSSGKLQRTKTKEHYLKGTLRTPRQGQDKLSLIKHWAKSQWSFLKHRTD